MGHLLAVTLIQAVSFNLIGTELAGRVDSYFAVLVRVLLAGLLFLPFTRWRGVPPRFIAGMMGVGALQFGITYLCLYLSFQYLTVAEVLLFTVLTPLHVVILSDLLQRTFRPRHLLAAAVAVLGAGWIRYDGLTSGYLTGFLLLQVANGTYAAGQVYYRRLMQRYPSPHPPWRRFGYFFLGALLVVLPAWLGLGQPELMPDSARQWAVLGFLGVFATALGQFWWNLGATRVSTGVLAVMNNAPVPIGLLLNATLWQAPTDWPRLLAGGTLLLISLWLARPTPQAIATQVDRS